MVSSITILFSYEVTRSVEDGAATFQFTTLYDTEGFMNITQGQLVELFIDGEKIATCRAERIQGNSDTETRNLTVAGRDLAGDYIDSTLGAAFELRGPVTFNTIVEKLKSISDLGDRQIINNTGKAFIIPAGEIVSGDVTETVFDFLEKYARKQQCFVVSDANGNIVLTNAESVPSSIKFLHDDQDRDGNNIFNVSFTSDNSQRFRTYRVHGQANPAGAGRTSSISTISGAVGTATDPEVRSSRVLDLKAETEHANLAALNQRAQWEATVRKARSVTYNFVTPNFRINNELIQVNKLCEVFDNIHGINRLLLIKNVDYVRSNDEGQVCRVEMVLPDVYLPNPLDDSDTRTNRARRDKLNSRNRRRLKPVQRKRSTVYSIASRYRFKSAGR